MNFETELSKTRKLQGSFGESYDKLKAEFNCVEIIHYDCKSDVIRVFSCELKSMSWRILLLCIKDCEQKFQGIALYDVVLQCNDLNDLLLLLGQLSYIGCLKLEYVHLNDVALDEASVSNIVNNFINGSILIDYISINIQTFIPDFGLKNILTMTKSNYYTKESNFSGSVLNQATWKEMYENLKYNPSLSTIALRVDSSLLYEMIENILSLHAGSAYTTEDEATIKKVNKEILEKNKNIKAINKIRKKNGLEELIEIKNCPSKVMVDNQALYKNTTIFRLYLSYESTIDIGIDIDRIDLCIMKYFPYITDELYTDDTVKLTIVLHNIFGYQIQRHCFGYVKLIY